MQHYSWTDAMSCGNEFIDADHRNIFDIAHRLHAAKLQSDENHILIAILAELVEYIHGHFSREEAFMHSINFPERDAHQFEHGLLMLRVRNLLRRFAEGNQGSYDELSEFVQKWIRYHIMNTDMALARYTRTVKFEAIASMTRLRNADQICSPYKQDAF
ncbi:hypothetical protein GCM10027343_23980 [Noviherbaspirillum agri]